MNNRIRKYCVKPSMTLKEVLQVIDKNRDGIALVVDDGGRLVGTITDGDIRRFMLANRSFDEPCASVMWTKPITAPVGTSREKLLSLVGNHRLKNIPLLDGSGKPKEVVTLRNLLPDAPSSHVAVIMAGGEGRRLRPLTNKIPKPMVRIGDRPILAGIVENLAQAGISKVFIAVNYQAQVIEDYFNDGKEYGVSITYLKEKQKMGTAGALSLLPETPVEPVLVINGDIVTEVNYARILDFHRQHRSVLTVAATQYHIQIPYGTLDLAGHFILGIDEKPSRNMLCNAGIYALNPEVLRLIPKDRLYNMTDLMNDTIREGLPVAAFPILEYWVDVGRMKDLEQVREDAGTAASLRKRRHG